MKIIILTSFYPYENIGKAGNITLYEIIKCLLKKKNEVKVLFCTDKERIENRINKKSLKKYGRISFEDFSSQIFKKNYQNFRYLRKVLQNYKNVEDLKLDKKKILNSINQFAPDKIILFWDTILGALSEDLQEYETIHYGAKPPFSAFEDSLKKQLNIKNIIDFILLKKKQKLHFSRLRKIKRRFNISKLDCLYYRSKNINVKYLQNTSSDKYENLWQKRFKKKQKQKLTILGNISDLNATGNFQGLSFINNKLFPLIKNSLISKKIKITISGKGKINPVLRNISTSEIFEIKGFVNNLENLILSSDIILMMNNAGSYSGGYTRIIDFFSSGACVIAHSNLKKDMPEIENMKNILLGSNPKEINHHLFNCINNFSLRKNIGINARKTFEKFYNSNLVTSKLIESYD